MIKKLLALAAIGMMAGCNSNEIRRIEVNGGREFVIYEFDGCEYVCRSSSNSLAHKGNCKNLIHKR